MSKPPDRETLRNLISAVLPTDSDLQALCIDRFPETARRFTDGMDRVQKVNLLLVLEGLEQILQAIQERDPARYDQHRQQLSLPPRRVESPMASQAASAPKQVPVTVKPTAANIEGGQAQDMTSASGQVHVDVVIITALKEEYDEARKVDEGAIRDWSVNHDLFDREVAFRTYEASNGPLRILCQSLIELAKVRLATEGQQTKQELVYEYLTSPQFRQRIEAIVEAYKDMREDLVERS